MAAKYWMSPAPTECDIDQTPITNRFVDGVTIMGPWANMCPACHAKLGRGLGLGKGQEYTKQEDGKWLKTNG